MSIVQMSVLTIKVGKRSTALRSINQRLVFRCEVNTYSKPRIALSLARLKTLPQHHIRGRRAAWLELSTEGRVGGGLNLAGEVVIWIVADLSELRRGLE